jgi:hypothetical protein
VVNDVAGKNKISSPDSSGNPFLVNPVRFAQKDCSE